MNALMDAELLEGRRLIKLAVEGHAACGTPAQVLKYHCLDGASLAQRIARRGEREGTFALPP